jgi:cytochrome c biogenesis protein CcmG/thiol:disulfide interchange protein DsbE
MKKIILSLPLILVLIISGFLLFFLLEKKDPTKPPSALLNEDVPEYKLPNLYDESEMISEKNLKGKVTLINFFASWCAPCKAEHPLFFEIKKKYNNLFILGIDMQDENEKAIKFLSDDGNPYDYVGVDKYGFIAIEFGVVGLPETFIVNSSGKIIYKYLGPLTKEIVKDEIEPLL